MNQPETQPFIRGSDSLNQLADQALKQILPTLLVNLAPPLRQRVKQRMVDTLCTATSQQLQFCIDTNINPATLAELIANERQHLEMEQQRIALLHRLLQAGASLAMVQALLGISKKHYTRVRKELGIQEYRYSQLTEQQEHDLYRLWERQDKSLSAETLLELHDITGHPLRIIWDLVQDWQQMAQQVKTRHRHTTTGGW